MPDTFENPVEIDAVENAEDEEKDFAQNEVEEIRSTVDHELGKESECKCGRGKRRLEGGLEQSKGGWIKGV